MNLLFLEAFNLDPTGAGFLTGGIIALIMGMLIFLIIFAIIMYVFTSLVFMAIAKKAKYRKPGLAWIPYLGPMIVANRISGMHWWPLLLLIGFWIPYLGSILMLVVAIFFIIWLWKTFEAVNRPGWWAILCIIPIVNIVLLAIAAWSK